MTIQINTRTVKTGSSLQMRLKTWLAAFEEATAYDPYVHAAEVNRQLRLSVKSLEARVLELEKHDVT